MSERYVSFADPDDPDGSPMSLKVDTEDIDGGLSMKIDGGWRCLEWSEAVRLAKLILSIAPQGVEP